MGLSFNYNNILNKSDSKNSEKGMKNTNLKKMKLNDMNLEKQIINKSDINSMN